MRPRRDGVYGIDDRSLISGGTAEDEGARDAFRGPLVQRSIKPCPISVR
jgi:hypothetical protein